jgi:hypothetical protein
MKGYPKAFVRLMTASFLMLIVSGMSLIPNLLVFKWGLDLETCFEGATRMKVAAAHVSAAIVCVWFIGALWPVHMRSGMRRKKNRFSGIAVVTTVLALAASGIGSFYFGDEGLQKINGAIHLGAGAALVLTTVIHRWMGMASRKT